MKMPKITIKDPRLRTAAAIVLVTVLGGALWYQRLYVPKSAELRTLNAAKVEKQDRLNAIRVMKAQRDRLIEDVAAKRRTLDSLKSIFPDQKEVPRLIQEVTRLAREANIYTVRFLPQPDNVREHYVESRHSLTMWGGYHEFAGFIGRLANQRLIINLGKMRLSAHPSLQRTGAQVNTPYTVVATFDLTTFSSRK